MKRRKKRKINWISIMNMVGFVISFIYILNTIYYLIFKCVSLTYFGLGTMIIAMIICCNNYEYFEERMR